MSRRFKKCKGFLKKKSRKPKHNWRNECNDQRKMLDMKRERYFRFDIEKVLEKTANQDNKNIIASTLISKAANAGVSEALDYIGQFDEESLEPHIAEEIKKLLGEYSTFR